MKTSVVQIGLVSLIGWTIAVVGTLILSLMGVAHPFFALNELITRAEVSGVYNFETFGVIFTLWATSAFLLVSGPNLFTSPSIESLFPIILLLIVGFLVGYLLGFSRGVPANILIVGGGTILGILLAFLVPYSLPTAGLSLEDQELMKGIVGTLVKITYLVPPNFIAESVITMGLCIGSGLIGGIGRKVIGPKRKKKRK